MATNKEVPVINIEELKSKLNVPDAVYEGMKAKNNWKAGKAVTEEEFKKEKDRFLNSPINGRMAKK